MKVVITIIALSVALSCYGQIEKGQKFLGGYVYTGSNRDSYRIKTSGFGTDVTAGYMVSDNFAVGSLLGYSGNVDDANGGRATQNHGNQYRFAAFGRRYFLIDENFYLFIEARANGNYNTWFDDDFGITRDKVSGWYYQASVLIGASYFVSHRVALNTVIGGATFTRQKQTGPDGWLRWDFDTAIIISNFNLGATIYFK